MHVANIGDSAAVVVRQGAIERVSELHTLDNEKACP